MCVCVWHWVVHFCAFIHNTILQIHVGSDMLLCNCHFTHVVVVAVAVSKGPFDNGCKISCMLRVSGCSLHCCSEGQSIYSCPFPEPQKPSSLKEHEQRAYSVTRERRGERKFVWMCVSEGMLTFKCGESLCMHFVEWSFCETLYSSICVCVCVCVCHVHMTSSDSRGIPTRY